ncbi:MAG TPA: hypothetical protein VN581_05780 [Patescibacteria group bacterium]|nr:hypothetical protein [Patescibacteria group bacterium]
MSIARTSLLLAAALATTQARAAAQIQLETTIGKPSIYCTDPGNPDNCALPPSGQNILQVEPGEEVLVGFSVRNTGDIALTSHSLVDSDLGFLLNNFPYTLPPGASAFLTQRFAAPLAIGLDTRSATWTGTAAGGVAAADADVYGIDVLAPQFTLEATVAPATSVCSNPADISTCTLPIANTIAFVPGQKVVVGYEVRNTGTYTLPTHTLVDSAIGTVLNHLPYALLPGAGAFLVQFDTPAAPATRSATWTVTTTHGVDASRVATYTISNLLFVDGFE